MIQIQPRRRVHGPGLLVRGGATSMIGHKALELLAALPLAAALAATPAAAAHHFETIDVPNSISTVENGINNSQEIVGVYYSQDCKQHGFTYLNKMFTTLDEPRAQKGTLALGINDSGTIVGAWYSIMASAYNPLCHGYIFRNGQFSVLDNPLGVKGTILNAINDSGQIVGVYYDSQYNAHSFSYFNGKFMTIDPPSITSSSATGVDNAGDIILSTGSTNYLLSNGEYTTIIDLRAQVAHTHATSINNENSIVGYYSGKYGCRVCGFITTNGVYSNIIYPGYANSGDTEVNG